MDSTTKIVVSGLGALWLSFLAGSFVTYFDLFPYTTLLKPGFLAWEAQQARRRNLVASGSPDAPPGYCCRKRYRGEGLVDRDPDRSRGGFTLYSAGNTSGATLLTPDGEVAHTWSLPFREAWSSPPHVDDPVPEDNIAWRKLHLFPNGDLLAVYSARFDTDTPNGYGLIKVDADSEPIWRHAAHVHHDLDVGPDGRIYTLEHAFRDIDADPVLGDPPLGSAIDGSRVLDDFVLVLSPSGQPLRRISILDAMVASSHADILQKVRGWDVLHTNAIDLIEPAFARHHDFAEPGDVMVSFRSIDAIAILDLDDKRLRWLRVGSWEDQHDPDPLANGNVLVYDNNGMRTSRLLEVDPSDGSLDWTYGAQQGTRFRSEINGEQDPLADGNVLVTESRAGRIFEVTRDREVVWDYRIPDISRDDEQAYIPSVLGARRIPASEIDFQPDNL